MGRGSSQNDNNNIIRVIHHRSPPKKKVVTRATTKAAATVSNNNRNTTMHREKESLSPRIFNTRVLVKPQIFFSTEKLTNFAEIRVQFHHHLLSFFTQNY